MSVTKYPKVVDEWTTLKKLQEGLSIARFGDGEIKMATGKEYVREPANRHMARELSSILTKPDPRCLVGIWPLNPESPKYPSMSKHRERIKAVIAPKIQYYSSLISRPDSAPWIRTRGYALKFESLWVGKRVVLLAEQESSARRLLDPHLGLGCHIVCPRQKAYAHIDEFEQRIMLMNPEIAILSCGPTATCLANRLSKSGIQAIDFGSGGSFLAKLLADA